MGCDHKFPFSLSLPAYPLLHASAQGGGNPFSLIIPVHVKPVQIPIRAHVTESGYPALCLCNHGKMFLKGPVPCFHIHQTAGPGIQLFFCIVPAVNTVHRIVKQFRQFPAVPGLISPYKHNFPHPLISALSKAAPQTPPDPFPLFFLSHPHPNHFLYILQCLLIPYFYHEPSSPIKRNRLFIQSLQIRRASLHY